MTDSRWAIGWVGGGGVVVLAAGLLLSSIGLGRRIVRQAKEITTALDGARGNTAALFDLTDTNAAIERTTRGLRAVRGAPET